MINRQTTKRRIAAGWLAAAAVALTLVAGCSNRATNGDRGETVGAAADPGAVHIHGLGVNPKDGTLYAATHMGLFRVSEQGAATRIADRYQDTMGFTIVGPDRFLGSGHPDLRDLQGGKLPPLLGLIESTDAGQTWQPRSLLGKVDFHTLRAAHGRIYGYDSTGGALMVSPDGATWESRSKLALRDFVVSPSDPETLLATTNVGVQRSQDGGRTWTTVQAPALVVLAWESGPVVWGVAQNGAVHQSQDSGVTWIQAGSVGGPPEAFTVVADKLYAAVQQRGILVSNDAGASWQVRYKDPS